MAAILPAHKTDDSIIQITKENFPAVFAGPRDDASKRYVHVPTNEFIPIAEDTGWEIFNAGMKKRNSRSMRDNPNAQHTARHFVAFRPSESWMSERGLLEKMRFDGGIGRIANTVPRLIVYNSHDRTSALEAILGIYEFICSNSSIMCSDTWGKWKFRHMNIDVHKVLHKFFTSVLEGACHTFDIRNEMQNIEVTENQALEFADSVIDLRWDGAEWKVDPKELIACHHNGQEQLSAWNVFNRVQENITKGGFKAERQTEGKQNKTRKQTKIRDFTKDLNINSGLWGKTVEWLGGMQRQLPPPPKIDVNVQ